MMCDDCIYSKDRTCILENAMFDIDYNCLSKIDKETYANIYNKAIDDFAEKIIKYVDCGHLCQPTEMRWSDFTVVEMVKKIAEQLKEGGENGT